MHWSLVVVHILIIAIISHESFPIDLMEIEHDDIYLVDKERKGRFIEVNQTTFLPNPIELIREKKSSVQNVEKSPNQDDTVTDDVLIKNEENKSKADVSMSNQPEDNHQTCADSLFEPQAFGYPAFFEDHFKAAVQHSYFSNPMYQMLTDNCCHLDNFAGIFSKDYSCIENFMVPEVNSVC